MSAESLAEKCACANVAGTEDISQLLEDMGLNLQSMMASRFVRPFADEVRKWEQRLSLVSECIEIWMLVQRKWMYLESIFMDSDDIRHQLPQVGVSSNAATRTINDQNIHWYTRYMLESFAADSPACCFSAAGAFFCWDIKSALSKWDKAELKP